MNTVIYLRLSVYFYIVNCWLIVSIGWSAFIEWIIGTWFTPNGNHSRSNALRLFSPFICYRSRQKDDILELEHAYSSVATYWHNFHNETEFKFTITQPMQWAMPFAELFVVFWCLFCGCHSSSDYDFTSVALPLSNAASTTFQPRRASNCVWNVNAWMFRINLTSSNDLCVRIILIPWAVSHTIAPQILLLKMIDSQRFHRLDANVDPLSLLLRAHKMWNKSLTFAVNLKTFFRPVQSTRKHSLRSCNSLSSAMFTSSSSYCSNAFSLQIPCFRHRLR